MAAALFVLLLVYLFAAGTGRKQPEFGSESVAGERQPAAAK
jgi:hypothetical protein